MNQINEYKKKSDKYNVRTINGRRIFEVTRSSSSSAQSGGELTVLRVPEIVGKRYKVIRFLSSGGQGAVFVAEDLALMNRKVLIKTSFIKKRYVEYGLLESDWEQFHKVSNELMIEANNLIEVHRRSESRLPCLLRLIRDIYVDAFIHPKAREHDPSNLQTTYLVMQYLPGGTLRELIRVVKQGKHPIYKLNHETWWRACLIWLRQIASMLETLHSTDQGYGLIYCDLKPDNCIISKEDISLIDFGAIKEFTDEGSQAGGVLATPGFCAPESHIDSYDRLLNGKADIYSAGAMLWNMLSGERPTSYVLFNNRSPDLLGVEDVLPSNLPASLHKILKHCLDRDRDRRPTAKELKDMCRKALPQL